MEKRKQKTEDNKIPYIDPDNVMSPEDMARMEQGVKEGAKPVVEMIPDEKMPLAIYAVDTKLMGMPMNMMMSIVHDIKANTIEMRGRSRFDVSGNKQSFHSKPVEYSPKAYEELKKKVLAFLPQAKEHMQIVEQEEPLLLEFEVGESADSIMHKMERSNRFNIGIVSDPEKVKEYERIRKSK